MDDPESRVRHIAAMENRALEEALRANLRLDIHEKGCTERQIELRRRLDRIEKILISCAGGAILLLVNTVFKLV